MITFTDVIYLGTAIFVLYGVTLLLAQKPRAPLPPGPKGYPFIGNLNALPPKGVPEWKHWTKHKSLYGPISSVTALGTTIIVLSDPKAAVDLLERRGSTYSSRPRMAFSEMCGWIYNTGSIGYGSFLKASRQKMHKVVGSKAALSQFSELQEIEARRFLLRVLQEPENWVEHLRKEAAAIILKVSYGYNVEPHGKDLLVDLVDRAAWFFSKAAVPGAWIVDVIPWMRYLPNLPGIPFQQFARESRQILEETASRPLEFVKGKMKTGKYESSLASMDYENAHGSITEEDELLTKWSAVSLFIGGSDTVRTLP